MVWRILKARTFSKMRVKYNSFRGQLKHIKDDMNHNTYRGGQCVLLYYGDL